MKRNLKWFFFVVVLTIFVATLICCGNGNGGGTLPPPPVTSVSVSPKSVSLQVGANQQFTAKDQNGNMVEANWFVNDTMSGNSTLGTIDISGLYTTPSAIPSPATVTVKGCSRVDTTKCDTATVTVTAPPPPPDKVAFWIGTDTETNPCCEEIYSMDPNGSDITQLTEATPLNNGFAQNLEPAWSYDHTKIAFVTNRDKDTAIYIMNADGSKQHRIQNGLAYSTWPAWSPDGTKIAFIGKFPNTSEIGLAIMNPDGTGVTQLTHLPCPDSCTSPDHPSWSPDRTKIVFDSPTNSIWQIFSFDFGTDTLTNLSNNNFTEAYPAYSPNGKYISYYSTKLGGQKLFIMTPDGGQMTQLTFSQDYAMESTWSKDSNQIILAMRANSTSQPHLFKIGVNDSSSPVQLTTGVSRYPSWH
ncbi:MAG: PD40 domain-containing protein [Patescibacteria group bacterium]|nr:PD40 domain-containing protein [Patescibacteria group bacterium]MDE2015537.1 PD40 domain-containing protein [Patescibacteria group bacterium]MDE2227267.1 PD40 domain-containing protein [Patescibacteria group bacterium]